MSSSDVGEDESLVVLLLDITSSPSNIKSGTSLVNAKRNHFLIKSNRDFP
jgi:hypothetical protein